MCNKQQWQGDCHWHEILPEDRIGPGKCILVEQAGGIGSFGPDCGIEVAIFRKEGCPLDSRVTAQVVYPGWPTMFNFLGKDYAKTDKLWVIASNLRDEQMAYNREAECRM